MFSDDHVQGSNATAVQIFIGQNSKYIDIYRVAMDHDLSCTLEENIMNQGAMGVLFSDNAKATTCQKVKDILCMHDRIPSTTPGAEPPRDAKDSGSARSHPTHLETSSSNRP